MTIKNNTNYNLANIFKFIFSFFVIAAHTKAFNHINNAELLSFLTFFGKMCVPFFFLCMGYSLAEKINFCDCKNRDLLKIKYILKSIIKQYLIWSLVYLPLALVEYAQTGNSFIYSFFSYLKGLFLKGEHYNSWMLWYLLSFIYALSFVYLCLKRKLNFKIVGILCLLIGSLSFLIKGFSIYDINTSSNVLSLILKIMKLTIDDGRIFTGFIYIYLGILAQSKNINLKNGLIILLVGIFCSIFSNSIMNSLSIIFCSLAVFTLSLKVNISNKFDTLCNNLRDLSTSNYYLHMWVFSVYYYLVYGIPTYSVDCFLFTTLITLIIGILYIVFKNRIIVSHINK